MSQRAAENAPTDFEWGVRFEDGAVAHLSTEAEARKVHEVNPHLAVVRRPIAEWVEADA